MSLLEQILDAGNGASVVSENHDVNFINFVAGLSDPGEMIRCGYLPQIRRLPGEADVVYAARIRPIVLALPKSDRDTIMNAAIRRARLDNSNGRVAAMFAGKPAWHNLGVVVDRAATSAEAIKFAGLDWPVLKIQNGYDFNGTWNADYESYAIVRGDTGAKLGTVGRQYAPIQNAEGFSFLDETLAEFGARYETAGSIYGGKRVWMLARLPKRIEIAGGDVTECFAMFSNCHDGSGAAWCFPTTVRVECANTFRLAAADRTNGLSIRHSGNVKAKIEQARVALGIAVREVDQYQEAAEAMVNVKVDAKKFANGVLDEILEISEAQSLTGAESLAKMLDISDAAREAKVAEYNRLIARRETVLEDILSRYDSERCRPAGSVWAAFNAVTEHADHNSIGKKAKDVDLRASRRFESIMSGDADAMKQVAYTAATALLA